MAYIDSYTQMTVGSVAKEVWDEAWFSVMSWKGFLQSVPGFRSFRACACALPNGDIRFMTLVAWDCAEQLEEWLRSKYSIRRLLESLEKPAYDIISESYEDLST